MWHTPVLTYSRCFLTSKLPNQCLLGDSLTRSPGQMFSRSCKPTVFSSLTAPASYSAAMICSEHLNKNIILAKQHHTSKTTRPTSSAIKPKHSNNQTRSSQLPPCIVPRGVNQTPPFYLKIQRLRRYSSCDNSCSPGAQPCSALLYSKPYRCAAAWHWWSVIPTQGVAGLFLALSIRPEWGLLYWSCGLQSLPCISPPGTRRRACSTLCTQHTKHGCTIAAKIKYDAIPITSSLQSDMKAASGKEVFLINKWAQHARRLVLSDDMNMAELKAFPAFNLEVWNI